jgi:peptide/nickel transport system ATP-binding protein
LTRVEQKIQQQQGAPLMRVENLKTYLYTSKGVVKAVDDVSFDIMKGEILGIVGESGSGKTMTALSLMRLIPTPPAKIVSGKIELDGEDLVSLPENKMREIRGSKISMVFQDPLTSLNPLMKVGSQIGEVLRVHNKQTTKDEANQRAVELLKMVEIPEAETRASQYPFELSGGMRQRVMIAIALAANPELIIADEPTTNLDATIQAQVLSLLKSAREKQGTSILVITHNLGIIAWICDRVAVMYAGRVVESGPTKLVLENPLHPYTKALLKSVPRIDNERGKLETIPGEVPKLMRLAPSCHFNPRCPFAMSVCTTTDPMMVQAEPNHWVSCFLFSEGKESKQEGS